MNGFGRKLRRFKETWITRSEDTPQTVRSLVGFLFYADDTPRFWAGDRPWVQPEIMMPPAQLPRFRNVVSGEPAANDTRRRAA